MPNPVAILCACSYCFSALPSALYQCIFAAACDVVTKMYLNALCLMLLLLLPPLSPRPTQHVLSITIVCNAYFGCSWLLCIWCRRVCDECVFFLLLLLSFWCCYRFGLWLFFIVAHLFRDACLDGLNNRSSLLLFRYRH